MKGKKMKCQFSPSPVKKSFPATFQMSFFSSRRFRRFRRSTSPPPPHPQTFTVPSSSLTHSLHGQWHPSPAPSSQHRPSSLPTYSLLRHRPPSTTSPPIRTLSHRQPPNGLLHHTLSSASKLILLLCSSTPILLHLFLASATWRLGSAKWLGSCIHAGRPLLLHCQPEESRIFIKVPTRRTTK